MPNFDLSTSVLIASFVTGTIGFSLFLYGKKQARIPQLVSGLLMMALPLLVPGASGIWIGAAALCAGSWVAVRAGY